MKNKITIFLLFSLLAASPAFGQTKLLTGRINGWFDLATGQPSSGDSIAIFYNSNLQTELINFWKLKSGDYVLIQREVDYAFDANGNLLTFTIQEGNDVDGWVTDQRTTYTYNANNQVLSWLIEDWDGVGWTINYGKDYTYDTNGNLLTEGGDVCGYLITYTYNTQNLLEVKLEQTGGTSNWVDKTRTLYTHLPNGKVDTETSYYWINSAWGELSRISYIYDASGDLKQLRTELWDNGAWTNNQLETRTYDANKNITNLLFQNWGNGSWENSIQYTLAYTPEAERLASDGQFWLGTDWAKWNLSRYYYSEFVDAQTPLLAEFQVYPNPTSSAVTIKGEGLSQAIVFDQQGRPVRSQRLHGQWDETLHLGNLPAGNYLLQVLGNDGKMGAKPLQIRR